MLVEAKSQSALLDQVIPRRGSPKHFLAARTSHATKLLLVLLLALPAVVQAQFTFTTNGGAITITGYTGSGGAVVIPSETNGLPVTGIGNSAFYNKSSVTSVMIPNSVTSLGDSVFKSCISLSNVVISSSVTSIGAEMFRFCYQLASVAIPDSVTSIGTRAFGDCSFLTSVTIGNSVTNLGDYAFEFCYRQAAFYFSGNAPSVGTSVFLNASVDAVAYYLPGTTGWGPSLGGIAAVLLNPPFNCTTVNGTITIKKYTGSAAAVDIPDTINGLPVTSIGMKAFYYCTSLTSVVIPSSVTNIGARAFYLSTGLTGVYFRGDAPFADSLAFASTISTVYWLPGTLRWGLMFAERPTALWLPKLQSSDGSFGVRTNQFGFNISWASGMNIAVDACTNLATLDWVPLQTNTLTADTFYFSDPDWADHPRRFYRVRWP